MKNMKIHEGAGLGAASGGRHDRRERRNEQQPRKRPQRSCLISGKTSQVVFHSVVVRFCVPSDRAARRSLAPNPAIVLQPPWNFMVKSQRQATESRRAAAIP